MKPKEKAKELVEKFDKAVNTNTNRPLKKCALILANEMLNNFLSNKTTAYGRERYHYWQEVKQELEKL